MLIKNINILGQTGMFLIPRFSPSCKMNYIWKFFFIIEKIIFFCFS